MMVMVVAGGVGGSGGGEGSGCNTDSSGGGDGIQRREVLEEKERISILNFIVTLSLSLTLK